MGGDADAAVAFADEGGNPEPPRGPDGPFRRRLRERSLGDGPAAAPDEGAAVPHPKAAPERSAVRTLSSAYRRPEMNASATPAASARARAARFCSETSFREFSSVPSRSTANSPKRAVADWRRAALLGGGYPVPDADAPDPVPRFDLVQDAEPIPHVPEEGVAAVEVRLGKQGE